MITDTSLVCGDSSLVSYDSSLGSSELSLVRRDSNLLGRNSSLKRIIRYVAGVALSADFMCSWQDGIEAFVSRLIASRDTRLESGVAAPAISNFSNLNSIFLHQTLWSDDICLP